MSATKSRKSFTKEFKIQTVKSIIEDGRQAAQIARELEVHYNTVSKWVREFRKSEETAFPGKGNPAPTDEENRRLKKELASVKMERDILKKAVAIFSKTNV